MTVSEAAAIGICATSRQLGGRHGECRYCAVPVEELIAMLRDYGVAYQKDKGHVVVQPEVLNAESEQRRLGADRREKLLRDAQEKPPAQWFESL